jgi:hypothetical protein
MSVHLDAEDGVQATTNALQGSKASSVAFGYRLQRQLQGALSLGLTVYSEGLYSGRSRWSLVVEQLARRRSDVPTLRRLFARDSQIIVSESPGAALWPQLCDL